MHVVAAHHGAQQFCRLGLGDQSHRDVTVRHGGEKAGLHLGSVIHTRWNAVGQQIEQKSLLTGGRVLDQLDQLGDLRGFEGQWWDTQCSTFCDMISVGFQHFFLRFRS
ncbi:hypothetical protein D3C71_1401790 [compost metagenome]